MPFVSRFLVWKVLSIDEDDVRSSNGKEAEEGRSASTWQEFNNRIMSFDVRQAKCFLDSDRDHLLGVIAAGFGTFDMFNEQVSSALPPVPLHHDGCLQQPGLLASSPSCSCIARHRAARAFARRCVPSEVLGCLRTTAVCARSHSRSRAARLFAGKSVARRQGAGNPPPLHSSTKYKLDSI